MKPERSKTSFLLPTDQPLHELRVHTSMAPHSGAMFSDQHRNNPVTGYPGQQLAHDVARGMWKAIAKRSESTHPIEPLEMGLSVIASHLHTTLPGPELRSALEAGGGYPVLGKGKNVGKDPASRDQLTSSIHERREQVKRNWVEEAAHLPPAKRRRVTMPSPPREPMTASGGGGYISPSPAEWTGFDTHGSTTPLTVEQQREKVRDVLRPLSEPSWQPAPRSAGQLPPPFHGKDVREAEARFRAQEHHLGEVGRTATAKYVKRETPTDEEVRVSAVESTGLHAKKKGNKKAGAHEVIPTDEASQIAALSDDEMRTVVAHTQADVRTSTALTFFRGKPL